jgi:hypothetical protein
MGLWKGVLFQHGAQRGIEVLSHFFPLGCSLVSRGINSPKVGSEEEKMTNAPYRAGQNLFLPFSAFQASLLVRAG